MKTLTRIALCLVLPLALLTQSTAQEKAESEITIVVPEKGHEETEVKVNGKLLPGEGEIRKYKVSLDKTKETKIAIQALIQPNNYEKITRIKYVTLKGGETAKVDMTRRDQKNDDRIKARWVPTPDDIVDKMAEMAKVGKNDVVYDLGCGDAVMLIRPLQKLGAKRGVGIDIDPKMVAIAKKKVKEAGLQDKIEIREGDIFDVKDMSDATVVLLYIGDRLGEQMSPVLRKTMMPGSRIVSHRFHLGDWAPTRTETVTGADGYEYTLHLWIVGDKKGKAK
jgi:uncharacterized protein (TIGR03000 family)